MKDMPILENAHWVAKVEKKTMKYRSRMDIVLDMLEAGRSGVTKSQLTYKAYLSGIQLTVYLEYLQERGLLRYDSSTNKYVVTENGLRFLNKLYEINDLVPLKIHAQF